MGVKKFLDIWFILSIGLGGALGALVRVALRESLGSWGPIPMATLVANVCGCFLAGVAVQAFGAPSLLSQAVLLGFLGALTTFSSFALDSGEILRTFGTFWALGNVFLNNFLGLLFCFLGIQIARMIQG